MPLQHISYKTMEIGNLLFGNSRGEYLLPRDEWEDIFRNWLDKNGFDSYGNFMPNDPKWYGLDEDDLKNNMKNLVPTPDGLGMENDIFTVRPYFWQDDDNEELMYLPNFVYKPDNVTINWYKYPLRDSYISHDITITQFKDMLDKCTRSLNV